MTTTNVLSKDDISRLVTDRSYKAQVEVVEKLAEQYAHEGEGALTASERLIANDIFRLLLKNAQVTVRAMLALNLSQTNMLPAEIARELATDVDEVAGPILQYSTVLNDDDLAEIIGSLVDTGKLSAIAKRVPVSERVSGMLVDTHMEPVINTLIHNENAQISDQTFEIITKHHGNDEELMESLLLRDSLPPKIIEKVVHSISSTMRKKFEEKYGDLHHMAEVKLALSHSLEMTSLKMAGFQSTDEDLMKLVKQLDQSQTMPPFSALSMGNLQLFEVCFSRLLHISLKNTRVLLQDPAGFKIAYERAKLPEKLFEGTVLAVQAIRSLEDETRMSTNVFKPVFTTSQVIQRMQKLATGKFVKGVNYLYAMMQHWEVE